MFDQLTLEVSRSDTSLSIIIPMVNLLRQQLQQKHDKSLGIQTMRSELLKALNKRFDDIEVNEKLVLATVLDPRFKLQFINVNDAVITRAKNWLTTAALVVRRPSEGESEMKTPPSKKLKLSPEPETPRPGLWSTYAMVSDSSQSTSSTMSNSLPDKLV
jgi:hypothetical protein